jgi:predicted permease
MLEIFIIIAPLFLIIFATALLRHIDFISGDWTSSLNQFVLKIGLPTLVFISLAQTNIGLGNELQLIAINFSFLVAILVLSFGISHIFRLKKVIRNTVVICLMFSNVAYLGIPLLTQVFDHTVLPQLSIIIAVYLFTLFGVGVAYLEFTRHTSTRSLLKIVSKILFTNPILVAVFFGIIVSIINVPLPTIIINALEMITASITPIVLVIIGVFIGRSTIGSFHDWYPVVLFSLATVLLLPFLFYYGLVFFQIDTDIYTLSIIESAMPLGITPFALAKKYNLDRDFIARSIVLSTIISIMTLPFWISFLT